ncbi:unnamed protein product [Dovyalis caffra]|uniref:Uncharacterized protein n=1 Tax=Dovyalis caffra TaxID=77055 RepID=A0AAV1RTJ1_9ROSI|nr:unnamed protein product [Dovyalis caffra]
MATRIESRLQSKLELGERKDFVIDVMRDGRLGIVVKKELYVLLVGEDLDSYDTLEDTLATEELVEAELNEVKLSLNSVVGLSEPRTLKLRGNGQHMKGKGIYE